MQYAVTFGSVVAGHNGTQAPLQRKDRLAAVPLKFNSVSHTAGIATFRFLHKPSMPNPASAVANRGNAPGNGVVETLNDVTLPVGSEEEQ